MAASNSLNIQSQGVVYFNGITQFSGLDGSTLGKVLMSNGPGVPPSFQTPAAGGITTLTGDSGSATGSNITLYTNLAGEGCGRTVLFANSGSTSLFKVTDALQNTLIGNLAGNGATTGTSNTALGMQCMQSLTSGQNNTAVGVGCFSATLTGVNNTAIGLQAALNITGGSYNTCLGMGSGATITNTDENVCVGYNAMGVCAGAMNICIGSNSMNGGGAANNNVIIGWHGGANFTSASNCVGIGYQSLVALGGAATNNTAIGFNAGSSLTTTDSNNINISNTGTAGDNAKILIGTNGTHTTCFVQGISGVTVTGTAVLCSTAGQLGTVASSARYKENILEMPKDVSVLNLRPVRFNYRKEFTPEHCQELQYGLIAEEVDKEFPYLCFYKEGKPESVKYHELCVFLLAEIQRLEARVGRLEAM